LSWFLLSNFIKSRRENLQNFRAFIFIFQSKLTKFYSKQAYTHKSRFIILVARLEHYKKLKIHN